MREHIAPLLKWWWLLALTALITGASAYWVARPLPSVYLAKTTLLVGRGLAQPNPNGNDIGLSQQLATAYADLATREPVQTAALAALKLTKLPDYTARANGNFVEISVTHSDAHLAQAAANELANQLILQSPTNALQGDQQRLAFINQQLDDAQQQIGETKAELAAKQKALGSLTGAVEIANAQNELAALQARLTVLETNFANLLASTPSSASNSLSLFEAASVPTIPIGPNKPLIVGLAAVCGLLLAAGGAYLLETLDTSVRSPEEIARLLPYPVLGHLAELDWGQARGVFAARHPRAPAAEALRSLRTNLEFSAVERPIESLLVTSINPADGKTFVASNLAYLLALAEKKVVLLDADLRQPSVHQAFQLSNTRGLGEIFLGSLSAPNAINVWPEQDNLGVITAGTTPPNPTELIGSRRMDDVLAQLQETADMVIVDSAPLLVADTLILAAKVDAVLLVVRPGTADRHALRTAHEQIRRTGARVAGVVLNRLPREANRYYAPRPSRRGWHWPAALARPAAKRHTQASLELLQAVTRLSSEPAGPCELWQRLLDLTLERMGASGGSILLFDGQGQVVDGAVAYQGKLRPGVEPALSASAQRGLAGWVGEHRSGALVANTLNDTRWLRQAWEDANHSARSAVSVPVIAADRLVGILTLTHARVGYFSDDDLGALTAVATWVSLSARFVALATAPHLDSDPEPGPAGAVPLAAEPRPAGSD